MTADRQVEAITALQGDSMEQNERLSITKDTVQSMQDKAFKNDKVPMGLRATIIQLQAEARNRTPDSSNNGFTLVGIKTTPQVYTGDTSKQPFKDWKRR